MRCEMFCGFFRDTEESVLGDSKVSWQIPAWTSVVVNHHWGCFGISCGKMRKEYPATLGCGCRKRNLKGGLLASFFFSALVFESTRPVLFIGPSVPPSIFWAKLREEGGSLFHSHSSHLSGMAEVKDRISTAETSVRVFCLAAVPLHASTICCFLGSNAGGRGFEPLWCGEVRWEGANPWVMNLP